jgi:hypothetical protein
MEEITCELRRSRRADAFLACAVGLTLAIVALVPFADTARALLYLWTVAGAAHARVKLRRVRALQISAEGYIVVHEKARVRAGRLAAGSFVSPWLTIVNWRPEGARYTRTLVLLPDMVGCDALRNIRVILRWS